MGKIAGRQILKLATDQVATAEARLERLRCIHQHAAQAECAASAHVKLTTQASGLVDAAAMGHVVLCANVTLCAEQAAVHARGYCMAAEAALDVEQAEAAAAARRIDEARVQLDVMNAKVKAGTQMATARANAGLVYARARVRAAQALQARSAARRCAAATAAARTAAAARRDAATESRADLRAEATTLEKLAAEIDAALSRARTELVRLFRHPLLPLSGPV